MGMMVGILLALAVSILAGTVGWDRDRSFYPVVLVVVASTYELFAAISGSIEIFGLETIGFLGFVALSVLGFKKNLWLVVVGLAGHGLFDLVHAHVIADHGVPVWWPGFCSSYDIVAAGYLGWFLTRSRRILSIDGKAGEHA